MFIGISIFENNININNNGTIKTATDNYLFNGVSYDIELKEHD